MTEFKQIIGRGTRVEEDFGKLYFTIIDFRNVTDKFADKDFDGAPVLIKEASQDEEISEQTIDEGEEENQIDPVTGEEIAFPEYRINDEFGNIAVAEPKLQNPEKREKVRIAGVDVHILSERKEFSGRKREADNHKPQRILQNRNPHFIPLTRQFLADLERLRKKTRHYRRAGKSGNYL